MKDKTFWKVLKEMGLKWRWRSQGAIRSSVEVSRGFSRTSRGVCPITAVCFKQTGIFYVVCGWEAAAKAMGLDLTFAEKLQEAADGKHRSDPQVRATLLETVGLEGEPI